MIVEWTNRALDNLDEVLEYVAADNPEAAATVAQRIWDTAQRLAEHPRSGRPGRVDGTRELIVPGLPYVLPYSLRGDRVFVLRVMHTSRRWPKSFT